MGTLKKVSRVGEEVEPKVVIRLIADLKRNHSHRRILPPFECRSLIVLPLEEEWG